MPGRQRVYRLARRITKNEADIADTKAKVVQVVEHTQVNTEATTVVRERVTVVEKQPDQVRAAELAAAPVQAAPPAPLTLRLIVAVEAHESSTQKGSRSAGTVATRLRLAIGSRLRMALAVSVPRQGKCFCKSLRLRARKPLS